MINWGLFSEAMRARELILFTCSESEYIDRRIVELRGGESNDAIVGIKNYGLIADRSVLASVELALSKNRPEILMVAAMSRCFEASGCHPVVASVGFDYRSSIELMLTKRLSVPVRVALPGGENYLLKVAERMMEKSVKLHESIVSGQCVLFTAICQENSTPRITSVIGELGGGEIGKSG